jgi:hypothetical protein
MARIWLIRWMGRRGWTTSALAGIDERAGRDDGGPARAAAAAHAPTHR